MDNSNKEETYRLLEDPKTYKKEIEENLLSEKDSGFTDYQTEVALEWIRKKAGITRDDDA